VPWHPWFLHPWQTRLKIKQHNYAYGKTVDLKDQDTLIEQSSCYKLLQYSSHACSKAGDTPENFFYDYKYSYIMRKMVRKKNCWKAKRGKEKDKIGSALICKFSKSYHRISD